MALYEVHRAHQNDAPGASSFDHQLVAWLKPGLPQSINRDGRLILAANAGIAPMPMLYLSHDR